MRDGFKMFKIAGAFGVLLAVVGLTAQEPHGVRAVQTFPTMSAALDAVRAKYGVHTGLEYAAGDTDRLPISLDFAPPVAGVVFDSLAAQKPGYVWKLEDGVYDVYPKLTTDSILDVRIREFAVQNATPEEVSTAIENLPEVQEWLRKHHVQRNELETGPRWAKSDPRTSLTVRGVALRSVLNRLVQAMGRENWFVVRYGEHEGYIGIYI